MDDVFYPDVSTETMVLMRVILENIALNPNYLSSDKCPYDAETTAFLAGLAGGTISTASTENVFAGEDRYDVLERECMNLYSSLKKFGDALSTQNTSEKMAFFRTSTNLLEKLLEMAERAKKLNEYHKFQETVMALFEQYLTPDQITKVMEKLHND